jgi:hypothetical protein
MALLAEGAGDEGRELRFVFDDQDAHALIVSGHTHSRARIS